MQAAHQGRARSCDSGAVVNHGCALLYRLASHGLQGELDSVPVRVRDGDDVRQALAMTVRRHVPARSPVRRSAARAMLDACRCGWHKRLA